MMGKRKIIVKNYAEESSEEDESKPTVAKKGPAIVESDCDESDSENKISEYEKLRLKNIEERNRLMRSLGFDKALQELNEVTPTRSKPKSGKKKNVKVDWGTLPKREPSRRIRNIAAATAHQIEKTLEEEESEEEKDDRFKGSMPMKLEDEESQELLKRLKDLKEEIKLDPDIDLKSCSLDDFQKCMTCLHMSCEPVKLVPRRIQSILVHPSVSKQLVLAGDVNGYLGFWDLEMGSNGAQVQFRPHKAPINCISVSTTDPRKIYTTGHDGVIACADLELNIFSNLYATDFNNRIRHMTWHDQIDNNRLLITHGNGSVGVLDVREPNIVNTWIPCFERSARTVQHHPHSENYFLVSSGACYSANVYDIRTCSSKKAEPLNEIEHPKGLTSAFFSPAGDQILTTCNDDNLRIFTFPLEAKPMMSKKIPHNNHTGRWLSVFKAMWHPARNDVFTIGSLLSPRRIQLYGTNGKLIGELKNEEMTTISPLISAHPTLPFIVGGNSSGRVHAFTYATDK